MKAIINTSRLLLREFHTDDAGALFELNSDAVVMQYAGDPPFDSVVDARKFVVAYDEYIRYGMGRWAVIRRDEGNFIGWCGLKRNCENEIDLGFRLFRSVWGQGYATEAAKACLAYGFDELLLDRIIGRAMKPNVASIRVLEKLGMAYVGDCSCGGEDAVKYELVR